MGFYDSMEEKYYHFMDFLEDKLHLPVYKLFIEPVEKRGIPSFKVVLAVLFLLVAAVAYVLFNAFYAGPGFTAGVYAEESGDPVAGATVRLLDDKGEQIAEGLTGGKGQSFFAGFQARDGYSAKAIKQGFASETIDLKNGDLKADFFLKPYVTPTVTPTSTPTSTPTTIPDSKGILKLTLLDRSSKEVIAGSKATVEFFESGTGASLGVFQTATGVVSSGPLARGTKVVYKVDADGYVGFVLPQSQGVLVNKNIVEASVTLQKKTVLKCGNGVLDDGEVCDGFILTGCGPDETVCGVSCKDCYADDSQSVCGDGVMTAEEQCESNSACLQGLICTSDCTCSGEASIVSVFDSSGNALTADQVFLFNAANPLVFLAVAANTNKAVFGDLDSAQDYFAQARKQSYASNESRNFKGNEDADIRLPFLDDPFSVYAKAVDSYEWPQDKAFVSLTVAGFKAPVASGEANSTGEIDFANLAASTAAALKAFVTESGKTGETAFVLDASKAVKVTVKAKPAILNITLVNSETGKPIPKVTGQEISVKLYAEHADPAVDGELDACDEALYFDGEKVGCIVPALEQQTKYLVQATASAFEDNLTVVSVGGSGGESFVAALEVRMKPKGTVLPEGAPVLEWDPNTGQWVKNFASLELTLDEVAPWDAVPVALGAEAKKCFQNTGREPLFDKNNDCVKIKLNHDPVIVYYVADSSCKLEDDADAGFTFNLLGACPVTATIPVKISFKRVAEAFIVSPDYNAYGEVLDRSKGQNLLFVVDNRNPKLADAGKIEFEFNSGQGRALLNIKGQVGAVNPSDVASGDLVINELSSSSANKIGRMVVDSAQSNAFEYLWKGFYPIGLGYAASSTSRNGFEAVRTCMKDWCSKSFFETAVPLVWESIKSVADKTAFRHSDWYPGDGKAKKGAVALLDAAGFKLGQQIEFKYSVAFQLAQGALIENCPDCASAGIPLDGSRPGVYGFTAWLAIENGGIAWKSVFKPVYLAAITDSSKTVKTFTNTVDYSKYLAWNNAWATAPNRADGGVQAPLYGFMYHNPVTSSLAHSRLVAVPNVLTGNQMLEQDLAETNVGCNALVASCPPEQLPSVFVGFRPDRPQEIFAQFCEGYRVYEGASCDLVSKAPVLIDIARETTAAGAWIRLGNLLKNAVCDRGLTNAFLAGASVYCVSSDNQFNLATAPLWKCDYALSDNSLNGVRVVMDKMESEGVPANCLLSQPP